MNPNKFLSENIYGKTNRVLIYNNWKKFDYTLKND